MNVDIIVEIDEIFIFILIELVIGIKFSNIVGVFKFIMIKNFVMVDILLYEIGGDLYWDKVIFYILGVGLVNGVIIDVFFYGRIIVKKMFEVEKVYLDGDGIMFNGNGFFVIDLSNFVLV